MTNATVGQLVAEQPGRSRVFEQYGIDYCCGGKKPLTAACVEKGIDPQLVYRAIAEIDATVSQADLTDWTSAPLTRLADHIEETHHAYLRRELPRLTQMLAKVSAAHGVNHPEMLEVERIFGGLHEELIAHLMKEEQVLFPAIRAMESTEGLADFHCGSLLNPIRVMEYEHDNAGAALAAIRRLTHDFTAPPDACNTFRATLAGLQELEADIHQHIHKENNILFPRAAAAERGTAGD